MATEEPRNKAELLRLIDERWAELQALVGGMSVDQMELPLGDGWSAKVHVAHLAAWERSAIGLLLKQHRGDAMGLPRSLWDAHDRGDEASWPATGEAINTALAARAGAETLDQVLAQSTSTHAEVVGLLENMTEAELTMPYSHYQPDDLPFNGRPVFAWVNGNTWGHYEEHSEWLKAGLGR